MPRFAFRLILVLGVANQALGFEPAPYYSVRSSQPVITTSGEQDPGSSAVQNTWYPQQNPSNGQPVDPTYEPGIVHDSGWMESDWSASPVFSQGPLAVAWRHFFGYDDWKAFESDGIPQPWAPYMLGDFLGKFYLGPPPEPDIRAIKNREDSARLRVLSRFAVADNRSPRPMNRVWYSYNFFSNVNGTSLDYGRHTLGGEFVLWQSLMSIEAWGNVGNVTGSSFGAENESGFGDFRLLLKCAVVRRQSFMVSTGAAVNFPTGPRAPGLPDNFYYVSPFVGFIIQPVGTSWFIQGWEQFDFAANREDQHLNQLHLGTGWWWWRGEMNRTVTSFAPTMEMHLYTPVGHPPSGILEGLVYDDVLNLTFGGTAFFLQDHLSIASGIGFPISNQTDYDFELHAHVNWRF